MTYQNIYTKFTIEYDKAGVTSSYPSLTEYEAATILDKAYLALIAQKLTGNNPRRATFEIDTKAVSDVQQLVTKKEYGDSDITDNNKENSYVDFDNNMSVKLPADFLYYVGCLIRKTFMVTEGGEMHELPAYTGPIDQEEQTGAPLRGRRLNVKLVSHEVADKFKATASNLPWIKTPVSYIEGDNLYIIYDSYDVPAKDYVELTYIKRPTSFVSGEGLNATAKFDLNDSMAEELVSLAVTFALENIESTRLNTKLNTRGLEA